MHLDLMEQSTIWNGRSIRLCVHKLQVIQHELHYTSSQYKCYSAGILLESSSVLTRTQENQYDLSGTS